MFRVFSVGDWQGVGGSEWLRIAPDGLAAVRRREELGLPSNTHGRVYFQMDQNYVYDRRAAESWPDALNHEADLPPVVNQYGGEFPAMIEAGLLTFTGPKPLPHSATEYTKDFGCVGLRLTCSAFELVQWRRAWAAEQEAKELRARVTELEAKLESTDEDAEDGQ